MDLDFVLHLVKVVLFWFLSFCICFRWAAIVVTTLLIRSCTVPLLVNQLKATAKLTVSFVLGRAFFGKVFEL